MKKPFQFIISTPAGYLDSALAIAASRAGELGVLDFTYGVETQRAVAVAREVAQFLKKPFGVKVGDEQQELLQAVLNQSLANLQTVVLVGSNRSALAAQIEQVRQTSCHLLLEVLNLPAAQWGAEMGVDGIIAKGHEAGGVVGEETTFILLQSLINQLALPVYAHGGVGEHTVGACYVAGAAGVVLDSQMALTRESGLPASIKEKIAAMDGSETVTLGSELGEMVRVYVRPGLKTVNELRDKVTELIKAEMPASTKLTLWQKATASKIGWADIQQNLLPLGQDAAFAAALAKKYINVSGIIAGLRKAIRVHYEIAHEHRPLHKNAPLAQSHHTRYPILQGPMTRVSDRAEFALAVANAGGLPFLALALMRGREVMPLLEETKRLMGSQSWGVGILGFVPPALRQEQMEAVLAIRPDFSIIAGGRPEQALAMEKEGIPTYLHVPSPNLLTMFLKQGAKRFIFEGRECGGHIGPRSSFVLWNTMVDVLVEFIAGSKEGFPPDYHIVFAGGIHDARSAAMVATIAAPLAELGVRIGVLMGTAYLFTEEAVSSGAIVPAFQEEAIKGTSTTSVETGPGHLTRCLPSPFIDAFEETKNRLIKENAPAEQIREELEALNVGRLRIASKGINRNPNYGKEPNSPKYVTLTEEEQREQGMYMIGQVTTLRDSVVTMEQLHEGVSVGSSHYLAQVQSPEEEDEKYVMPAKPSRIAIIGMGCLLPGAGNLKEYWENILDKVDAISEVPQERWNWERYYNPDKKARDKAYSRWGGFIKDIPFNPMEYGMPPNSVRSIEPVQLLMLEVVKAALKDAGYTEREFPRERTSCVIAVGGGLGDLGNAYSFRSYIPHFLDGTEDDVIEKLSKKLPEWTEDSFPGILLNVLAGRVANRFDLGGANFVVDAACGSSLAALDAGIKQLEYHESDIAIVGAGETVQSPFGFMAFSKTQALSPTGHCRPFDEAADGIAISEGLAVIILKRLEDAERDGDRIYAVIDAVGASSDGKDRSLTAPRPIGQMRAVHRAYTKAGISPATVGLFEAHGTGTKLGDTAEAETLNTVLHDAAAQKKGSALGSVKSMIGHTKSTAGLAGLIKVTLALYHKVLPPTLINKPNTKLYNDETTLYINSELRPWVVRSADEVRRAGVSAFGFGGTNFHAVLQEYNDILPASATRKNWSHELILFTARDRAELIRQLSRTADWLNKGDKLTLRDVAYSLYRQAMQREGQGVTLAIVAQSVADLQQKLQQAQQNLDAGSSALNDPRGIYFQENPLAQTGKVAFLYPGQGSQYVNMLAHLTTLFPTVRQTFERANMALAGRLPKPLSEYIFPVPAHAEEAQKADQAALTATNIAQPALGAANLAVSLLLKEMGIFPDFVAGHSYGELVALHEAGVIDEIEMFALSAARGQLMAEAAGPNAGTMAAVRGSRAEVSKVVAHIPNLTLANLNAPQQTVISGTSEAVEQAIQQLENHKLTARRLPVACAFHSHLVAPARDKFAAFMADIPFKAPQRTVFANKTAQAYPNDPAEIKTILSDQLASSVEFQQEIEAMYAAGARIFIEAGPKGVLTSLVGQILGDKPHLAIATDSSQKSGIEPLLKLLALCAVHGLRPNCQPLFVGRDVALLNLNQPYQNPDKAQYGATTWLINGGRARPWKEAQAAPEPLPEPVKIKLTHTPDKKVETQVEKPEKMPAQPTLSTPTPEKKREPVQLTPNPIPAPIQPTVRASGTPHSVPNMTNQPVYPQPVIPTTEPPTDQMSQLLMQYQQLMGQFLQTQQNIMLAYLGSAVPATSTYQPPLPTYQPPATPTYQPPTPAPQPIAAPTYQPPTPSYQPPPVPTPLPVTPALQQPAVNSQPLVASSPQPTVTKEQITINLQALVSDRTGYPSDLLNLEADLEADLGIDSIKRVEILGAFREGHPELAAAFAGERMEQLQSQRTLKAMIELISKELSSGIRQQPAAKTAPSPEASQKATPVINRETVAQNLITLVSDRTGYPPDLLGLEADLEADLGIDSIKRVEILGAFREGHPELATAFAGERMEQLQSQRTLKAMIELISQGAGSGKGERAQEKVEDKKEKEETVIASAPNRETVTQNLIALVSDRTGYPPELLNLDADLEADLGIDSIKRVEILGAFREENKPLEASFAGERMEKLQAQRTLRAMVDLIVPASSAPVKSTPSPTSKLTSSEPSQAPTPSLLTPTSDLQFSPILRFKLAATNAPLNGKLANLAAGRTIVITDDGRGVAQEVATELEQLGFPVVMISHTTEGLMVSAGKFAANLTLIDEVKHVLATIRTTIAPIGSLLHLAPLGMKKEFESINLADWQRSWRQGTVTFFHLIQAVQEDLMEAAKLGGSCLLVATDMGGAFGAGTATHPFLPTRGGMVGLLKTAAHETAGIRAKAVDLDPHQDQALMAQCILQELIAADNLVEVGYEGAVRKRLTIVPAHLPSAKHANGTGPINPQSIILITGGARGITADVAKDIARRYQPTLILVGRSPLPPEQESPITASLTHDREIKNALIQERKQRGEPVSLGEIEKAYRSLLGEREVRNNVRAMRDTGAKVHYFPANVRDEKSFGNLLDQLYAQFGRIDGVIHGAGIIEDKLIKDKTTDSFERVLSTKADSSFILARKLRPESLKFLVFFSSVSGRFGNRGQADYAAANEVMNKLAVYLDQKWAAHVVSMNWGPWDAGMVSDEVRRQFHKRGVSLIPISVGQARLIEEILYGPKGEVEIVICGEGDGEALAH